jgi:hypothetical protein
MKKEYKQTYMNRIEGRKTVKGHVAMEVKRTYGAQERKNE